MSQILKLDPKNQHSVVIKDKFIDINLKNINSDDSKVNIFINDKNEKELDIGAGLNVDLNLRVDGCLRIENKGPSTLNVAIDFI